MTATSEYNYYKQCIDKCVSQMNECKNNQKHDHLLHSINYMQNEIQTLYDIGDFNLDLSANESDEVFTDDQLKQLNYDFDSDALMF